MYLVWLLLSLALFLTITPVFQFTTVTVATGAQLGLEVNLDGPPSAASASSTGIADAVTTRTSSSPSIPETQQCGVSDNCAGLESFTSESTFTGNGNAEKRQNGTIIAKNIFQTWHTRHLPMNLQRQIDRMRSKNKEYKYQLFLDADMDAFVHEHFPGTISDCYDRINVMVGKADFWRYLILWKYGGVYVDIDASINRPLRKLIQAADEAIVTAEGNPRLFVQWALIFRAGHPILKRVIDSIVRNIIKNKYPNDIRKMTGPGAYSKAVLKELKGMYGKTTAYSPISPQNNSVFMTIDGSATYRIFGVDYNGYLSFGMAEYGDVVELYREKMHWAAEMKKTKKEFLKPAPVDG